MQITVALCTHNPNQETIVRVLDAVVDQLDEVRPAELVVVDNNSTPPLAERDYISDYPIRIIRETTPGLTAAREAAVAHAYGDIIVWVDDDNILGDGYLATVVEEFAADSSLGLLGGNIVPEFSEQPPDWFSEFEDRLAIRHYDREFRAETTGPPISDFFPIGAGMSVRRSLALAYLEDCARTSRIEGRRGNALSSGEDLDLGLFILSQRWKLTVTGKLSLTHVISSGRFRIEYLQRLATANVVSTMELERKWSPRFGVTVYPPLSMSLPNLLARTVATTALSLWSPRHKVKRQLYTTLTRARLESRRAPAAF